ncbi:MAG TPA: glycerophosphodiester phosphodiesterase family protein, partial [Niabella sp.]|nr:glycerophosphodiester phosphodiesterase family protein [Niabella sp.]
MKHFILFGVVVSILLTACTSQKMTTKRNIPFSNKVIAHRGAFKNTGTPENSLASLKAAIALGCGGAEFDIHMTADNILVINHDPEFLGIPIETTTYAQL